MSINFELLGMKELMDKLENMGANLNKVQNKALRAGAEILLEEEKENVPVLTGETKKSLKISSVRTKKGVKSIWVGDVDGVRGKIPYYIEYGTSKRSKRPFMRPAYYAKKNEILEAQIKILRDEVL